MNIYILCWSDKVERWGGNIHTEGFFSSLKKAKQAALKVGPPGSDATPWILKNNEWTCERHGTSYVMWINKEIVK